MKLPENVQPVVAALAKYHFWILAVLVPLLVVPMLVLANSDINKKIDGAKSNITSKISAVQSVKSTSPHPNTTWSDAIEQQTLGIRQSTWRSWDRAYRQQLQVRVWPEALGPQFLRYVDRLKPDSELPLTLRELYQNSAASIVRALPARMGAEDLMDSGMGSGMGGGMSGVGSGGMGSGMGGMAGMMRSGGSSRGSMSSRMRGGRSGSGGGEGGELGGEPIGPRPMVDWSAADQARIYESFVWTETPSTTQILLAQEELWVYGMLCDAIARANSRSTGNYNAAIPAVEEMLIGYQAAEDKPGGEGLGRIMSPGADAKGGMMSSSMGGMGSSMGMMSGMTPGGGAGGEAGPVRPPHPRFGGGGGGEKGSSSMGMSSMGMGSMGSAAMMGGGDQAASNAGPSDDDYYNWIYVDFDGNPLTKSDIDGSPVNRMLRLMPFTLRIRIGEQRLDEFLVQLATEAPVPIDVRQVRINPDATSGSSSSEGSGGGSGSRGIRGGPMGMSGGGRSGGSMRGGMAPSSMGGSSRGMGGSSMEGMGGMPGAGGGGGRPNDLDVELRGTICLVVQPDPEVIGLAADEIPQDDDLPLDDAATEGDVGPARTEEEEQPSEGDVS